MAMEVVGVEAFLSTRLLRGSISTDSGDWAKHKHCHRVGYIHLGNLLKTERLAGGLHSKMCVFDSRHRIIESLRLEKTSKIIKSNCQPNTTMPAKPCPEVPHLQGF